MKKFRRFGGYANYRKMTIGGVDMKLSSKNLSPVQSFHDGLPIYFLTGKDYLHQTLFCIQSLVKYSNEKFNFILIDDGSIDNFLLMQINKQLPGAVVYSQAYINENVQNNFPRHIYPHLHEKRRVYPHIKKLTDIHTLPGNSWKLVLDSDMLFWAEPVTMIKWLKMPETPLHMEDHVQAYGYSLELMNELCGKKIPPRVNVGAIGLNSNNIDWLNLEKWVKILEEREGSSYYLEQAISAMIIGDEEALILDPVEYIVCPAKHSKGTLHHYVDLSKEQYLKTDWKQFI